MNFQAKPHSKPRLMLLLRDFFINLLACESHIQKKKAFPSLFFFLSILPLSQQEQEDVTFQMSL